MTRGAQVRVRRRRILVQLEQVCPLCHEQLLNGAEAPVLSVCRHCGTPFHLACTGELGGGCATLGCPGRLASPTRPSLAVRARPRSLRRGAAKAPLGTGAALGAGAGFSAAVATALQVLLARRLIELDAATIVFACALLPVGTVLGGAWGHGLEQLARRAARALLASLRRALLTPAPGGEAFD